MNPPSYQNQRARLLDPNRDADVRVEAYMLSLGTVRKGEGPTIILRANPAITFRANKVLVAARILVLYPLWIRLVSWVRLPWVVFDLLGVNPDVLWWKEVFARDLWSFGWARPFDRFRRAVEAKQQLEALSSCTLVSLSVANVETLVSGGVSLGVFYYGVAPPLDFPTCPPQNCFTAVFKGSPTCDFDVMLSGFGAVP